MTKTILITGASTGFGRDTAETLARAGHEVFASMRDPERKNRAHAEALQGQNIEVVELDVTDSPSVDRAVAAVIAKAGRIDVLINNAGVAAAGVSEAFTPEQASALFDVNVIGLHRVTRAVLPELRRHNDGLIINIGSIVGRVTFPFFGLYGASKFAIEALTDSVRYEVSQLGIGRRSRATQRLSHRDVYERYPASGHGTGGRIRRNRRNPQGHVRTF